jgi:hypothetical protein
MSAVELREYELYSSMPKKNIETAISDYLEKYTTKLFPLSSAKMTATNRPSCL